MELKLTIKHEPVRIDSVGKDGFCKQFQLENGVVCEEDIPAGEDLNQYIISLRKDIALSKDAYTTENELKKVLEDLTKVWPVITGYRMGHDKSTTTKVPSYESNAHEVKDALLKKEKREKIYAELKSSWSIWNAYKVPPLEEALKLRSAILDDPKLDRLIKYLFNGYENHEFWFLFIYKVRDQLKIIHGNEKETRTILKILETQWNDFGNTLNNYDLRHPGHKNKTEPLDPREADRILLTARTWVAKELKRRNLPFAMNGLAEGSV